ncbi:MAG: vWA domain-containing protein [Oscillospiraceae bacterium]|nr:vWA domain-containing protein [Oscillospiraceae bacterium]
MQKKAARRSQRALAFLLCLLMVATLLPVMGASATEGGNQVTNPAYTGADSGLVLSKTLKQDAHGNYSLRLEAYATGDVTTTPDTVAPLDIVLVLDQSGSMGDGIKVYASDLDTTKTYYLNNEECEDGTSVTWNGSSWGYSTWIPLVGNQWTTVTPKTSANDNSWNHTQLYETRLDALKTAVNTFVSTVKTNATTNNVDHRIAIVGFASKSGYGNNTEILSVSGKNSGSVGVQYNANGYVNATKDAFQDTTTVAGKTMLKNAIDALAANGATRTDLGMTMAKDILAQDSKKDEAGRQRVVIMFTDGTPTSESKFDSTVANDAISTSKTIKGTSYSAHVYTIGIFDGADPTKVDTNENKFMNYVSSNYPKAASMNSPGTGTRPATDNDPSFYLAASDADSLSNVFSIIQGSITGSSRVNLTATAVLKDVVSDKFTVPDNVTLSAASYACTGKADDGSFTWSDAAFKTYTPVCDGQTVTVTGFDYKENYVAMLGDEPHGQKLVLTISGLIPKDSGEQVFSNTDVSGVYESNTAEKPVARFPMPSTNIPVYTKVLDFSMTANIATNVLQTNSNLNGTYGTFDLSSNNLTYKLGNRVADGNLVFDGVDSVLFYGDYNDDGSDTTARWNKVNVIPANNVYYDDDLLTYSSDFKDNNYGYDAVVPATTDTTSVSSGETTFTFKGRRIDVYCTTESSSGAVIGQLKDADGTVLATKLMRNEYESGALYNVPTLSFKTPDASATYTLTITTNDKSNYKLDGVRVYHPADETNETVQNAYANDDEQNAVFTQVRQLLISAKDFTSGMSSVTGAVYTDKLHDGATITDYEKIGPKNEVYLDNGNAIAFKVDGYQSGMKVMVGLSAPEQTTDAGDSVTAKQGQVTVSDGSTAKTQNISSNVDMYYAVTPTADGYVVITNNGSALISVTNVKLSGTAEGAGTFSVDDGLLAYMASFDSLEVTEPTPDEPDPIPDTPVQNDSISAIIHAIWAQVKTSIDRLFGRL